MIAVAVNGEAIQIEKREKVYVGTVVFALSVAALLYWRQQPENPFAGKIAVICVESGQVLELDRDEVHTYPLKHPETKRKTLLPFDVEGERMVIAGRFRPIVKRLDEQEVNKHVDVNTLEVKE
ncbi:MAG: hypothetical protein ACPGXK_12075 [Phycisphaerae bacterium]